MIQFDHFLIAVGVMVFFCYMIPQLLRPSYVFEGTSAVIILIAATINLTVVWIFFGIDNPHEDNFFVPYLITFSATFFTTLLIIWRGTRKGWHNFDDE